MHQASPGTAPPSAACSTPRPAKARLSSYGVEWLSCREEHLPSAGVFKEAVLAALAAIAKQKRIWLSERVQAGLSRAKAQAVDSFPLFR